MFGALYTDIMISSDWNGWYVKKKLCARDFVSGNIALFPMEHIHNVKPKARFPLPKATEKVIAVRNGLQIV